MKPQADDWWRVMSRTWPSRSILHVRDIGAIHQQLTREIRAFWFYCLSLFRYYRCYRWLLEVVLFLVTDLVSLGCSWRFGEYSDGGCGFISGVMITISDGGCGCLDVRRAGLVDGGGIVWIYFWVAMVINLFVGAGQWALASAAGEREKDGYRWWRVRLAEVKGEVTVQR
ncbi:hypothetical protein NC651_026075 [Populus alba x Populus x berolinensis]|nr:hypothetical protein NC651_026075 [Populus alba x Populus x berolinensis]